jgi:1-acyl-sn-glycerol-3-phosphate acyltransferase
MIIQARHHWFLYPFFKAYSRYATRFSFSNIQVFSSVHDQGLPILLLGNHTSWWDGFWAEYVNLSYFKRKPYVMMLEEQLRSRLFLRGAGAFSINKQSRSVVESIRYATEILGHRENILILYPQGEIRSSHEFPLRFDKGWFRILSRQTQPVQVVFLIALTDYFSSPKPSLSLYLYDYPFHGQGLSDLEGDFNRALERSLQQQRNLV